MPSCRPSQDPGEAQIVVREIIIEMTHMLVFWFYHEPGIWRFSAVIEFYACLPTTQRHWQNEDLLPLELVQYERDASRDCIVDIWLDRVLYVQYSRYKQG